MSFKQSFFITLVAVFCLAAAFIAGYFTHDYLHPRIPDFKILTQAYEILSTHGIKDLPPTPALEYGMIRGMVEAYNDPYTVFVEPPEHELESNTLQGSFGGIGVRIDNDAQGNILLYPFPGGPAAQAGVQEGDRLLAVEKLEIDSKIAMEDIQAALRGPVGSRVQITIAHPPDYKHEDLSIKRSEIPLPSVTWHIDPGEPRLGVIEINIIAASTPDEVAKTLNDLKSRGATAFLLDLRDNSGGLLSAGIDTTRLFLQDGPIISEQYRGQDVKTYTVKQPGPYADVPLAILVNQNTASAAEIIAGALKEHHRAKLIGTHTFGKGTVQLVFDLNDGSSLHVTAAHWWVPELDPPVEGNGLVPDISVKQSTEDLIPDPFIQAAIQLLFGTN
jgi:carboxyl-terminal processing protease